jgi:hypothetical protein
MGGHARQRPAPARRQRALMIVGMIVGMIGGVIARLARPIRFGVTQE